MAERGQTQYHTWPIPVQTGPGTLQFSGSYFLAMEVVECRLRGVKISGLPSKEKAPSHQTEEVTASKWPLGLWGSRQELRVQPLITFHSWHTVALQ